MSRPFPTTDPTWDMESVFSGGVQSETFEVERGWLQERADELAAQLSGLALPGSAPIEEAMLQGWRSFFDKNFEMHDRLSQAFCFATGMAAAHADDPRALRMPQKLVGVNTASSKLDVALKSRFRGLDDEVFEALLQDARFGDMQLYLKELRRDADAQLEPELEELAVELNRDGLHAWGTLYRQVSGRLKVSMELDGERQEMSVGQAKNLHDHADRQVRKASFESLNEAWATIAPTCAATLNSIVGAQQTLYERRGQDCLTYSLNANRVERATVDAMFEAARAVQPLLHRYLKAKQRLLGLEELHWYDIHAPVGQEAPTFSYEEAQLFIVEQVGSFAERVADFCKMALRDQWVEVEDRAGKAQGGYCSGLPVSGQTRIFMTFGGSTTGVTTLAHELGHAYHGWVMRDLPASERDLGMGVAETASTLLEVIVEQGALSQADDSQRLGLLDQRLARSVAFLMDIPARYDLELAMHEARAEGPLNEDQLTEMTETIFSRYFGESLASVDPLFWASKLHFYLTGLPFYNFPYTFGFLFSRAVYAQARQEGEGFIDTIDALLMDSGRMTSEELASRYLGGDLGDSKFWSAAMDDLASDVAEYETMVDAALRA
ncbi:oligoendopeptidase [Lujinxingia litoralis]|uniref:Oligoendopeptidase n=1 Tax=Lujinxingia litoralis TaxID=2211119 RepID=A0A328CAZ6_9DELT|nr:M3 family oligoendopeptidase [Lujinxingia litoralis]RAL22943.1 oligoendopeptidase [Lujinxingia litoralis]